LREPKRITGNMPFRWLWN